MKQQSRIDVLLKSASLEFINGRNPFDTKWLAANSVTLDECITLSERIAIIINGYLGSPEKVRAAILVIGAME